jgi:hypothetical protein
MDKKRLAREVYDIVDSSFNGVPMETKVSVRTAPKRISLPDNMMVFQSFAYLASTKLKPSTNRILMFFFAKSAYENFIGIDVKTLMEELKMSEPTVVNGLKELEVNNIIIKFQNTKDRRRHDYFINPTAAWKGNSFTRDKQIKKITGENPNQLALFDTK